MMKIHLATINDVDIISSLYDDCKAHMQSNGIRQWVDEYPNKSIAIADIKQKQLHKYTIDGQIQGVITLNEHQDPEYSDINWSFDDDKVLIVHRLAVHPKYQGKGIARQLMDFAESAYANKAGYESLRLDTFSQNPRSIKFYLNRGYQKRGEVHFPLREEPFHCLEKSLVIRG